VPIVPLAPKAPNAPAGQRQTDRRAAWSGHSLVAAATQVRVLARPPSAIVPYDLRFRTIHHDGLSAAVVGPNGTQCPTRSISSPPSRWVLFQCPIPAPGPLGGRCFDSHGDRFYNGYIAYMQSNAQHNVGRPITPIRACVFPSSPPRGQPFSTHMLLDSLVPRSVTLLL
jgi:hypothetical protein